VSNSAAAKITAFFFPPDKTALEKHHQNVNLQV
jgi:hypothetical protein